MFFQLKDAKLKMMKIETDPKKVNEVLTRGVENIYPSYKELEAAMLSGKKLRLYCGYDPSAPTLHIGHMITLRKLAQFQSLGHEVIMLIGDFTGMIGDPTDKKATRKRLTRKEVLENSKNYKKQASRVLKFNGSNPAKILYNSQWSDKLSFIKLIELASNFTVQQMIARDMFQERIKNKKPIYLHEFLYPLAQAYDSVGMNVDLEIGGRDQIFNMLCGRELIKIIKKKEKFVLGTKLLVDPAGKKMGKTEGNIINLNNKPEEIYGKIMAWSDGLIAPGFEFLTDVSMEKIKELSNDLERKKANPRDVKAKLAREIVMSCYGEKEAEKAERGFDRVFKEKKAPLKIPEIEILEKQIPLLDLLVKTKLAGSKSEAKRLVLQNGIKINGKLQKDWKETVQIKRGLILQAGKRKFIKISR